MKRGYRVTLPAEWCSTCVVCHRVIASHAQGVRAFVVQAWATPDGDGGIDLRHDDDPCASGEPTDPPPTPKRTPAPGVYRPDDEEPPWAAVAAEHGHPDRPCASQYCSERTT